MAPDEVPVPALGREVSAPDEVPVPALGKEVSAPGKEVLAPDEVPAPGKEVLAPGEVLAPVPGKEVWGAWVFRSRRSCTLCVCEKEIVTR